MQLLAENSQGSFRQFPALPPAPASASLVFPAAFSTARMPLAEVKQWRPYQIPQKRRVLWQEISMVLQGCQGWSEVGCFEMFRLWFFEEQLGISEVDQVSLLVFELQTLQQIGHRWAEPIPGCFFERSSGQQGKWYFGVATRNTPARTNRFFSSKRLAHQIKQHPRQEKHWKIIIWYAYIDVPRLWPIVII